MVIQLRFNKFPIFVTKILHIEGSNAVFDKLEYNLTIVND